MKVQRVEWHSYQLVYEYESNLVVNLYHDK